MEAVDRVPSHDVIEVAAGTVPGHDDGPAPPLEAPATPPVSKLEYSILMMLRNAAICYVYEKIQLLLISFRFWTYQT